MHLTHAAPYSVLSPPDLFSQDAASWHCSPFILGQDLARILMTLPYEKVTESVKKQQKLKCPLLSPSGLNHHQEKLLPDVPI